MNRMDNASSSLMGLGVGLFILASNLKRHYFFAETPSTLGNLKIVGAVLIIGLSIALWFKSNKKTSHNVVYGFVSLALAGFVALLQMDAIQSSASNTITLTLSIASATCLTLAGLMQLKPR